MAEDAAPAPSIVISLSDRMLYLKSGDAIAGAYRVAIGRPGVAIPRGATTIVRMRRDPTWRPTANQRRSRPFLPSTIPPGPSNPLGAYALDLGWSTYAIHGTNDPRSIGRRATGGCFRLAAADISALFSKVAVGTPVRVVADSIHDVSGPIREMSVRVPQPAPKAERSPSPPAGVAVAIPEVAALPISALPEPLFDPRCGVSTAPLRRLICQTPDLARLDGQIRALHAEYLGKISPDRRTAAVIRIAEDKRRFEERLVTRCWIRRDTETVPEVAGRAGTCLEAELAQRLEATREQILSASEQRNNADKR